MFVDLKAFDSVDRRELINTMRKRRVREGLIERIELLSKTKSKVRIGELVEKVRFRQRGE